jgi:hypothetical protein
MAMTLADVVFRRLGVGGTGHPGARMIRRLATVAAAELAWSPARVHSEIDSLSAYFVSSPGCDRAGGRAWPPRSS